MVHTRMTPQAMRDIGAQISRRGRSGLGRVTLGVALLLPFAAATGAYASHSGCRADPIVWLSDGHKLNLAASVETDLDHVQHITYTLHIPRGLSVTQVVYTANGLGGRESFAYIADQPPLRYTDTTNVQTAGGSYAATATLAIKLQGAVGQADVSGVSNADVEVALTASQ